MRWPALDRSCLSGMAVCFSSRGAGRAVLSLTVTDFGRFCVCVKSKFGTDITFPPEQDAVLTIPQAPVLPPRVRQLPSHPILLLNVCSAFQLTSLGVPVLGPPSVGICPED